MFLDVYRKYQEKLSDRLRERKIIDKTIDYCVDNNILAHFLRENRADVASILIEEFEWIEHENAMRNEGYEDGRLKAEEESIQAIIRLVKEFGGAKQVAIQKIVEYYPEYEKQIKKQIDNYWGK